jgi:tetratricopeptide (TPR) repeat protein
MGTLVESAPQVASEGSSRKQRLRRGLVAGALLVALVILAYLPALRAGFVWDDDDYITANANLRDLSGLAQTWVAPRSLPQYYPLVHTSFWLEYQLWDLWPAGYHATNVLLHALAAVLAWRVLLRLGVPGAWLAAALFALHPVQVESVAWATERKNVLSAAAALGALLVYLRCGFAAAFGNRERSWPLYALALTLFAAALLSKSVVATLPAVILVLIWWKSGRIRLADVWPLLPMFAAGIAMGLFTAYLERTHVGAGEGDVSLSAIERALVAGRAVCFYAGKLIWPADLSFIYPRWTIDAGRAWQYLFPVGVVLVVATLWMMRHRLGRGPLACVLIYAGVLAPALGFVDVFPFRYSFVADHFQYHASIALLALSAAGLVRLGRPAPIVGAVLLAALAAMTATRASVYHDQLALWQDTLGRNPASPMVRVNLAYALHDAGQSMAAGEHLRAACDLAPRSADVQWTYAQWLAEAGREDEALRVLDVAERLDPTLPGPPLTRGQIHQRRGEAGLARAEFERALVLFPPYPEAHFALGQLDEQAGRTESARRHYAAAVSSRLGFAEAHYNLANLLQQENSLDEAMIHYSQAIAARPDWAEAYTNLGNTLLKAGRVQEAIAAYSAALRIKPDLAAAQHGLRAARLAAGPRVQ